MIMEHHHLENQQHMDVPEFDPNFEPQSRARAYTWPSRPREAVKEDDNRSTPSSSEGDTVLEGSVTKDNLGLKAKTSSRRNAWGNLSYADLITKAIDNSPERRLTLSQIYDWMVQNVPYFKDKGDTNSSAGWKNSIRHNLSLHSRFMRIQNEGTGKSSWWVLNPDAKPGKTPRRRATSMDTKAYEKKRGRVKKKLEQLRALGGGADQSPTAGSDYGDSELGSLDPFSLSPQDFRARTSSNASSIGGRLSPIQSLYEPDLHDSQVPPMSPNPWSQTSSYNNSGEVGFTETLSESLAEMFVGESMSTGDGELVARTSGLSTPSPLQCQSSPSSYLPAPPPYSDQLRPSPKQMSPNSSGLLENTSISSLDSSLGPHMDKYNMQQQGQANNMMGISTSDLCLQDRFMSQTLSELLQDSPPSSVQPSPQPGQPGYAAGDKSNYCLNGDGMSSSNQHQQQPQGNMSSLLRSALTEKQQLARSQIQAMLQNQQQKQILQAKIKQLRQQQLIRQQQQHQQMQQEHLKQQMMRLQQQQQMQHTSPQLSPQQQCLRNNSQGTLQPHLMAGGMCQQLSTSPSANYPVVNTVEQLPVLPNDLDLVTISEGNSEDLQCDVDQIINHELSMDGLLDFNFETGGVSSGPTVQT